MNQWPALVCLREDGPRRGRGVSPDSDRARAQHPSPGVTKRRTGSIRGRFPWSADKSLARRTLPERFYIEIQTGWEGGEDGVG